MLSSIFLMAGDDLKKLGFIRSDREFSRLVGRGDEWVRGLRRQDGLATQRVHPTVARRLCRRMTGWRDAAPRPAAARLNELIRRIERILDAERWLAR